MPITYSPNLYGGKNLSNIYVQKLYGQKDLVADIFRKAQGNKDKAVVSVLRSGSALQAGSLCNLAGSSSLAFNEFAIPMTTFSVKYSECKDVLKATYFATLAGQGVMNGSIPQEVIDAVTAEIANKQAYELARVRWAGNTASADPVLALSNGVVTVLQAAGVYNATTNPDGYRSVTSTAITSANVVAEINKVLDATPDAVLFGENFKIIVSPKVARALQSASAQVTGVLNQALATPTQVNTDGFIGNYVNGGYPIYMVSPLNEVNSGNVMIAGNFGDNMDGNLIMATDAAADYFTINVQDLQEVILSDARIEWSWSVRQGVAVAKPEEVVLYL